MSIWHRTIVHHATYTMVWAICCFPKRGHFGKKNIPFLFRFGFDRKSLRCYVYRHFGDFEVSKNVFLFVFARRRFWTFFLFWSENVLLTRTRMQNGTPPLKSSFRKRVEKWDPEVARKTILGVLLVPDQGAWMCLKRVYVDQMSFLDGFNASDLAIVISNVGIRVWLFGAFEKHFFHFSSQKRLSLLSVWPLVSF